MAASGGHWKSGNFVAAGGSANVWANYSPTGNKLASDKQRKYVSDLINRGIAQARVNIEYRQRDPYQAHLLEVDQANLRLLNSAARLPANLTALDASRFIDSARVENPSTAVRRLMRK